MEKFSYSKTDSSYFDGVLFYEKYKEAEFLKDERNVQNILTKQAELDHFLDRFDSGESFEMEGMSLKPGSPLTVTKSGRVDEGDVDMDAFTPRRLSGLAAAYVFDHSSKFRNINASEPEALGVTWNIENEHKQVIYLSAVSGAEYFVKHFDYCPLVWGIKKYQLEQITAERLVNIFKVRDNAGRRMATLLNNVRACRYLLPADRAMLTLGGTFSLDDVAIQALPEEIKCFLEPSAA